MNRRTLLKLAALPVVAAIAGGTAMARGRNFYYEGPVSDHFDGQVFFNPGKPWTKTPLDLLKWNLSRQGKESWPERFPSPFKDVPPPLVNGSALRVTPVGHASFLFQTGGLNLLVDPVWADRASPVGFAGPRRVNAPGIAFEDLPRIHAVLLTHNHYDHLCTETMARLVAAHDPQVVTPLGNDAILRSAGIGGRVEARDWGDRVALSDTVAVHLEPCYHWSARGLFDRRHALWAAFVIEAPGGAVYHIGDTGYGDGAPFADIRRRHGRPRLAVVPIGAYEPRWFMKDQHVNPDEAVRIVKACGAHYAIGHHWGTFKLTDEGIERPLEALSAALAGHGHDPARFRPLRPGQSWEIPPVAGA